MANTRKAVPPLRTKASVAQPMITHYHSDQFGFCYSTAFSEIKVRLFEIMVSARFDQLRHGHMEITPRLTIAFGDREKVVVCERHLVQG